MLGSTARNMTCILTLMIVAGGCSTQRWATDTQRPTIEQFVKIRWPRSGSLAANGNFYFVALDNGINQLHRQAPGAQEGTPITQFADGIGGYAISEDGRWIAITAGYGGDEQFDIHLMDSATEQIEPLLVDRETVFGSVAWNRDSTKFAYRANKYAKADFNVFVYDMKTRTSKLAWNKPGYWYPADFTRRGNKLAVAQYVSASESHVREISLTGMGSRPIDWVKQPWSFDPVGYFAADTRFLVVSDYEGDRKQLLQIELRSGKIEPALPQFAAHDLDYAVVNDERDVLAAVVNVDGYAQVHLFSLPGFEAIPGPDIPAGVIGNVRLAGRTLLYAVNNANTPGSIYKWNIDAAESDPVRLTQADTGGIAVDGSPLPQLVRIKSFDGLEVPAFLYVPQGYSRGKSIPFVVSYHGGPEGQYRPRFSRHFQYFLSRGFGVLAPNVRGSRGYGTAYLEMDDYRKRMDSVRDGVACAQWLIDNGYTKPKMIGAYGGSYGGFMVMAVITQAPGIFGAACNVVGIVNFETFLKRTKAYRRKLREAEYGPLTDPDFLRSISPIHLVDRIETPVLIAHGKNDPRVPFHEAEQLYEALKARGQEPELLAFDDEGHGFAKEANRIVFYQKLADFFESRLRPTS